MAQLDTSFLQAVLVGYQMERDCIDQAIADIQKQMGTTRGGGGFPGPFNAARKKRRLSAEARKRIVAAQKKRWAAFHAKHAK